MEPENPESAPDVVPSVMGATLRTTCNEEKVHTAIPSEYATYLTDPSDFSFCMREGAQGYLESGEHTPDEYLLVGLLHFFHGFPHVWKKIPEERMGELSRQIVELVGLVGKAISNGWWEDEARISKEVDIEQGWRWAWHPDFTLIREEVGAVATTMAISSAMATLCAAVPFYACAKSEEGSGMDIKPTEFEFFPQMVREIILASGCHKSAEDYWFGWLEANLYPKTENEHLSAPFLARAQASDWQKEIGERVKAPETPVVPAGTLPKWDNDREKPKSMFRFLDSLLREFRGWHESQKPLQQKENRERWKGQEYMWKQLEALRESYQREIDEICAKRRRVEAMLDERKEERADCALALKVVEALRLHRSRLLAVPAAGL
eukprot:comp5067_c0_seq1/m.1160 comp5067_c0_seq1/g.1160  ORF comp5067_c0_seq1/g.1160 comp5067_c0_seq1/m.1160 type:complete len:378 (-) comp5067_c0_seq1:36-1169(-)